MNETRAVRALAGALALAFNNRTCRAVAFSESPSAKPELVGASDPPDVGRAGRAEDFVGMLFTATGPEPASPSSAPGS